MGTVCPLIAIAKLNQVVAVRAPLDQLCL